jgi:small-conductance mechanosensitive channel
MSLELLHKQYCGNPLSALIAAVLGFVALAAGALFLRRVLRQRLPPLGSELVGQIRVVEIAVVAFDLAVRSLELPHKVEVTVHAITVVVVAFRAIGILTSLASAAIGRTLLSNDGQVQRDTAQGAVLLSRILIWIGALLFVLSNLGFNVSSVLTGLGIGGVAVALAAQAVLGDLFAAIAIYTDKPFVPGDAIQVGDASGTVESTGVKTTRVRSDNGELLVYPNSMLTSARIQNFERIRERRAVVTFLVPLDTTTAVLRRIPEQARAACAAQADVRFERAHFASMQDSGLQFEFVFHVTDRRYNVFMDRRQAVLLALLDSLRADGIPFAIPKTSVVLQQAA